MLRSIPLNCTMLRLTTLKVRIMAVYCRNTAPQYNFRAGVTYQLAAHDTKTPGCKTLSLWHFQGTNTWRPFSLFKSLSLFTLGYWYLSLSNLDKRYLRDTVHMLAHCLFWRWPTASAVIIHRLVLDQRDSSWVAHLFITSYIYLSFTHYSFKYIHLSYSPPPSLFPFFPLYYTHLRYLF